MMTLYVIEPNAPRPFNVVPVARVRDIDAADFVVRTCDTIKHIVHDCDHAHTMFMFMSDDPNETVSYVASALPRDELAQSFDCENDEF